MEFFTQDHTFSQQKQSNRTDTVSVRLIRANGIRYQDGYSVFQADVAV